MQSTLQTTLLAGVVACLAMIAGCPSLNVSLLDFDGDGVADSADAFPTDPSETADRDGDGVGDNADAFPDDPSRASAAGTTPENPSPIEDPAPVNDATDTLTDPPTDIFAASAGDPIAGLATDQLTSFTEGTALYQRVFTPEDGLSDEAMGESCVSCHGATPLGAAGGIRMTRFVDGHTEVFVSRNVSPLYGVGLFERVSDAEILLRQDSLDADGDGISGRANVDVDRVGRFGRKAQAATLDSIVRGMLINQMGISADAATTTSRAVTPNPSTMQIQPPNPVDDSTTDPASELPASSTDALVSFQAYLGSPARSSIDNSIANGETLFATAGCAACHLPSLMTEEGEPLRAYTDLLLHDMGTALADGITTGVATETEFRTQPLWGVGEAAPYLHDGRATTLTEAIEAHAGEAQASASAFAALSASDQRDVISFLESL